MIKFTLCHGRYEDIQKLSEQNARSFPTLDGFKPSTEYGIINYLNK